MHGNPKLRKPAILPLELKKSQPVSHFYVFQVIQYFIKSFFFSFFFSRLPSTHLKFNSSLFRCLKSKHTFSLFKLSSFNLFLSFQAFKFQVLKFQPLPPWSSFQVSTTSSLCSCLHAFNPSLQMSMNWWCHPWLSKSRFKS